MRRIIPACALILIFAGLAAAQEKSLGEVAREARKGKSGVAHASKVFTNDGSEIKTVFPSDDPIEILARARAALLQDTAHRCRTEASGNSGPGWTTMTVTEVGGRGRYHTVMESLRSDPRRGEWIVIGTEGFARTGSGPWVQLRPEAVKLFPLYQVPEELQFRYERGDLKLVGSPVLDGSPTLQYQYALRSRQMERTVNIWIGAQDHLPRKTEMYTIEKSWEPAPLTWRQTTTCTYGGSIQIEPPN